MVRSPPRCQGASSREQGHPRWNCLALDLSRLLVKVESLFAATLPSVIGQTRGALEADAAAKPYEPVDVEATVESLLGQMAPLIVEHIAAAVDGGRVRNQQVCPSCGGPLNYLRKRRRTLGFLFGPVRVLRAWFHCAHCRKGKAPLETVWGLQEGPLAMGRRYLTPRAQVQLVTGCAMTTYGQACKHFSRLTGVVVSHMTGWRYAQRLGQWLHSQEEEGRAEIPFARGATPGKGRRALRWLVSADGFMVAFWRGGKRGKWREARGKQKGKGKKVSAIEWLEVKLGMIALLDEEGRVQRGSQWYVVAREKAAQFRVRLWRAAGARGVREKKDVVVLVTDGAKWLRALATRHFTWAIAIRDFYHAVGHLGAMGAALYGEGHWRVAAWQTKMASRLKREGASVLVAEWEQTRRKRPDEKGWQRELAYFRSQQEAMAYPQFQEKRLPIGSGPVEGGGKGLIGTRFRPPGARWSMEGFRNLLAIRVRYCNGVPIIS
jgi:hypothetical protein